MGKIVTVLTGGTIASKWGKNGKIPLGNISQKLCEQIKNVLLIKGASVSFETPLGVPGIDSADIGPSEWLKLTKCVTKELVDGVSAVLILHGTNTMANTAAWLSLCFKNIPIPIILTGSQLTLDDMAEDVTPNLKGAIAICCSDIKGVWIYFNWKLIPGDHAHKSNATSPDAFTAINADTVTFDPHWIKDKGALIKTSQSLEISDELSKILSLDPLKFKEDCSKINIFFALPGSKLTLNGDERILCLIGYGTGSIPRDVIDEIKNKYITGKKTLIIACSQAEQGKKMPESDDVVGIANLKYEGFKVFSQEDCTLEFVHSLCCYALAISPDTPEDILSCYLREC